MTSARQGRDESVLDYFKRFKDIKNRCFNLTIPEKNLADIALGGLRSHLRERLEGLVYYSINGLQLRAMSQETKFKILEMHISLIVQISMLLSMILICRAMRIKRFTLLNLFGHRRPNLFHVHHLSRFKRIGKKR